MHVLCYISKVTTNTIESTPPTVNSSPYQLVALAADIAEEEKWPTADTTDQYGPLIAVSGTMHGD